MRRGQSKRYERPRLATIALVGPSLRVFVLADLEEALEPWRDTYAYRTIQETREDRPDLAVSDSAVIV